MKVFFNESEDKAGKLIQSLRSAIDLNMTYSLSVVSCFFLMMFMIFLHLLVI